MNEVHSGRRVAVVGTTGSGKTTLAAQLAARLGVAHVELDALHWGPGWVAQPRAEFRAGVAAALAGLAWVADGNSSAVRDIVWGRAGTLIWLDYPLPLVLWRLLRRSVRRSLLGEELWNGNRERLRDAFLSRDSLLLWALRTTGPRRREYPLLLQSQAYHHLAVVRLRSPRETAAWLASLPPQV